MDEMRKAFEAWVCRDMTREQRIDLMPRYCTVGEPYMDRAMQARWVDWQAATMAERERCAKATENVMRHYYEAGAQDASAAIRGE